MILLALATLALGSMVASKINETTEMYAPKGYMMALQSRPRSAISFCWS